jgi:hypothetical protein
MQDMIDAADLVGFRGAPFPQPVIDAAVGAIRDECGWHIAPVREETIQLATGCSDTIVVPSLKVVEILEVTSMTGAFDGTPSTSVPVVLEDGILYRAGGWPAYVQIRYRHGFATCPDSLKAVVAEQALGGYAGRIKQESLAGRSVALEAGADPMTERVLARYRLAGRL